MCHCSTYDCTHNNDYWYKFCLTRHLRTGKKIVGFCSFLTQFSQELCSAQWSVIATSLNALDAQESFIKIVAKGVAKCYSSPPKISNECCLNISTYITLRITQSSILYNKQFNTTVGYIIYWRYCSQLLLSPLFGWLCI